jgi:preprotein translocase subunit SecA
MADETMSAKLEGLEPERWSDIEKQILIQTLDHHWKEHLSTLDALRQVIHLRSYAQKKPIDEYKQEAFLLFERLLVSIREEVTRILMRAQVQMEAPPPPPVLPDFITQHLDPFTGDDDTADIDAATGAVMSSIPFGNIPQQPMPQREPQGGVVEAPVSRNAPCPCGSGKKYKHCHGQIA